MNGLINYVESLNQKDLNESIICKAHTVCESSSQEFFSMVLKENFDIENNTLDELNEFDSLLENYIISTKIRNSAFELALLDESYIGELSDAIIVEAEQGEGIMGYLGRQTKRVGNLVQRQKWIPGTAGNKMKKARNEFSKGGEEVNKLTQSKQELENKLAQINQQLQQAQTQQKQNKSNVASTTGKMAKYSDKGLSNAETGGGIKQASQNTVKNFGKNVKNAGQNFVSKIKQTGGNIAQRGLQSISQGADKLSKSTGNMSNQAKQYANKQQFVR